jgi:hypothetical protein
MCSRRVGYEFVRKVSIRYHDVHLFTMYASVSDRFRQGGDASPYLAFRRDRESFPSEVWRQIGLSALHFSLTGDMVEIKRGCARMLVLVDHSQGTVRHVLQ